MAKPTPAAAKTPQIGPATLRFLAQLERNNRRPWFEAHRAAYERDVRDASVEFVRAMLPRVRQLSPHFTGEAKPVGGSIMRIHRDTRFSKDKRPYRTSLGLHYWHRDATEAKPGPAWYVHVDPETVFAGGGLHALPPASAARVRAAIAAEPARWERVKQDVAVDGEQLKRVPKPWTADHAQAEDLRRKQWLWSVPMKPRDLGPGFADRCFAAFLRGAPMMAFFCEALGFPF